MKDEALILVVDDDEDMRDVIRALLELDGFQVTEAKNAKEMYEKVEKENVSLILLDLVLPDNDGISIMREFRPTSDIPVVMLTGKGDIIDKIVGLEIGADDYITKPFHARELTARIKTVLRRHTAKTEPQPEENSENHILAFNKWTLDTFSHTLTDPTGNVIMITGHEFALLKALIDHSGRVLTRDQLLDCMNVGDKEWSPFDRSLDVLIAKIRKKLKDKAKNPSFIRTIRQSGYMFIADVSKL